MSGSTDVRILTLDLGTSSVRALVCDHDATPIPGALARRPAHVRTDADGTGELDADAYLSDLVACLDELAEAGWLDGVTAVGTSSQWHSLLALDAAGTPVGPVLTWLDTRAEARREPSDPEAFHVRTGTWPHRLYWTAKLPWLREQLDGRATGATRTSGDHTFLGLPDYLRRRLLDTTATSSSIASGTGALDVATCRWDAEALDLAGVSQHVVPPIEDEPAILRSEYARRWPQLRDVPWLPALGDGAASNLGSGADHASIVAITLGTSAALRTVHPAADAPPPPWPVWRYRVDAERMVSGIAYSGGGVLHAWVSDVLRLAGDGDDDLAGIAPGSHGLVSLPLHAGTRPPETVPAGSGAIVGLSLGTTREEILAATLEGAAFEVTSGLELLENSAGHRVDVVLGGGGAHASRWWCGVFAATLNRPLRLANDPEVGARGAAAHALGLRLTAFDADSAEAATVWPDPDDVRRLAGIRAEYDRLRAGGSVLAPHRGRAL